MRPPISELSFSSKMTSFRVTDCLAGVDLFVEDYMMEVLTLTFLWLKTIYSVLSALILIFDCFKYSIRL